MSGFGAASWRSGTPTLQPELFRRRIYSHPMAQAVNWWKARASTDYDRSRARRNSLDATLDTSAYDYVLQPTAGYLCLVQDTDQPIEMGPVGKQFGAVVELWTMPDEMPVGAYDKVQPIGGGKGTPRTYRYSEVLTRGSSLVGQAGTITSNGTLMVGIGTAFASHFQPGDVLTCNHTSARVVTVADDLHLTTDTAPVPFWSGMTFSKGMDRTTLGPIFSVEEIRDQNGVIYPASSYAIGMDGQSIQWLSATASPAPGLRYSLTYRFYPVYLALPDLGLAAPVVAGPGLPQRVLLRLFQPETFLV